MYAATSLDKLILLKFKFLANTEDFKILNADIYSNSKEDNERINLILSCKNKLKSKITLEEVAKSRQL